MRDTLDRLLVGIIIAALFAAGYVLLLRHDAENNNRRVEIAVDYGEVARLSIDESLETDKVYTRLKDAGATAVLFKEQNFFNLNFTQELQLLTAGEMWFYGRDLDIPLEKANSYFLSPDLDLAERIVHQLELKGIEAEVYNRDSVAVVRARAGKGRLHNIGLGFPEGELFKAGGIGLNTMVQIKDWPGADAAGIREFFKPLAGYPNLAAVLFNDHQLPGYPEAGAILIDEIEQLDVPVVTIEFFDQAGLDKLAYSLGKEAVRLHAIQSEELGRERYANTDEIIDRYKLAASERNVRILLVRFKPNSAGELNIAEAENLLQELKGELAGAGFEFGSAKPFDSLPTSRPLLLLMGLGGIAAGMLILRKLGWEQAAVVLGALAGLIWLGVLGLGFISQGRKLMALGTAVVFPILAVGWVRRDGIGNLKEILLEFIKMSAVSLAGGLLVSGLLSDVGFMLKLDQFAGVKAAHVVPLALLAFIFFYHEEKDRWLRKIRDFFNSEITVFWLLAAAVLAFAAGIYISRTGNTSAAVSDIELLLRNILSDLLGARPRTKEFLIGHPLMLLSLYLGYKHRLLPLWLSGVIGQVSVVNTYAHIHTPIAVSLLRTFNGLWLGIIVGIILIFIWRQALKYGSRWLND